MLRIIRSKERSQIAVATGSKRNTWGYLTNIRSEASSHFRNKNKTKLTRSHRSTLVVGEWSASPHPLLGKPWYLFDKRLGGSQNWSGELEKEKILDWDLDCDHSTTHPHKTVTTVTLLSRLLGYTAYLVKVSLPEVMPCILFCRSKHSIQQNIFSALWRGRAKR
jgi:hypothetical protein